MAFGCAHICLREALGFHVYTPVRRAATATKAKFSGRKLQPLWWKLQSLSGQSVYKRASAGAH